MDHDRKKEEAKEFTKFNENKYTAYPNLQHTTKAALRVQFITLIAYIKN